MRRSIWVGVLFLLCVTLFGCKRSKHQAADRSEDAKGPTVGVPAPNAKVPAPNVPRLFQGLRALSVFPAKVRDGRHKWIKVKQPPRRIIVAGTPLYSQILLSLGAAKKIVGVTSSPGTPASLKHLETIGKPWPLNVERVLSLQPDLVLGAVGPYRTRLEAAGDVPVLSAGNAKGELHSLSEIDTLVRQIDRLVHGNTVRSQMLLHKERQAQQKLLQRLPTQKVPAVIVYLPRPQGSKLYVSEANTPAGELLSLAGGKNVLARAKGASVGLEALIEADPDVIITAPRYVPHFLKHRALQGMQAIRRKRVFGVPPAEYTSSQYRKALKALLHALHPKAYPKP